MDIFAGSLSPMYILGVLDVPICIIIYIII